MHPYRTHTCGELRQSHIGETLRLSGWVLRVRDHGGILFIDLRDHYGVTQVVADPESPAFATAEKLRSEWVVRIDCEERALAQHCGYSERFAQRPRLWPARSTPP
jgi:aspartyl-tRNA synthetase